VKLPELLAHYADQLTDDRETVMAHGLDAPLHISGGHLVRTVGSLFLYAVTLAPDKRLLLDVPLTILPDNELDPTEGFALGYDGTDVLLQTMDSLGNTLTGGTLIPDTSGFLETATQRLTEMRMKPEAYAFGPAERLIPWINPNAGPDQFHARSAVSTSVLTTLWGDTLEARRTQLGSLLVEHVRKNKRILLVSHTHQSLDEVVGFMARALRNAALPFKSLLSCYEMPILQSVSGLDLRDVGFEYHMHKFFANANAYKTTLRKKYARFRELTPILAYKKEKQKDLQEVKLLEWRLLTQLSEWQGKIKHLDQTLADYEALSIWKRLAMQTAGKNVETLAEYRKIYQQKVQGLMGEVEIAQARIRELVPKASIPKDMRPEYEELKEEISRFGGTQKIRELLSAGEGTNRQAFAQNKRILATTPGRLMTDPLFRRLKFDVLIIDEAPKIPAPLLLGAAGLIRERIVMSGNTQDLLFAEGENGGGGEGKWPSHMLPELYEDAGFPSNVS